MILFKKLIDYIYFSRPILFFPAWTSFLLFDLISNYGRSITDLLQIMGILTLTMASGFIINQINDIETDRINEKCFFLNDEIITVKEAKILATLFAMISIVWSYQFSLYIFSLNCASYTVGLLYSLDPIGLKNKPYGNIIAQSLMGFIVTACAVPSLEDFIVLLLIYNLINTVLCLLTTIPDIKGDVEMNKLTFAVKYGERNTAHISFILLMIGCVLTLIYSYSDILLVLYLIFIGVFILYYMFEKFKIEYLIKLNLLVQALIVSYFYSFYFIMIIATYFLSRIYFKNRFNIRYPQLFEE